MVECAFVVVANNCRIFHRPLDVTPQFYDNMVKDCCILQNFLRRNDGFQLEDTLYESNFESIEATGARVYTRDKRVRDDFPEYFKSSQGSVLRQYVKV
jgi:hypothetical protein